MFLGLSIQAWITIIVLVLLICANAWSKIPSEFLSMAALAVLITCGALGEHAALSGFASEGVVITGAQDIIVLSLLKSGAVVWVVNTFLGRPKKYLAALVRVIFPVAFISSIVDDLATTSVFINVVKNWSRKIKIAPSKLLLPVAYASLMGGSLTLIGTAPNIIISSLYAEQTGTHMNIFLVTLPALFCLLTGALTLLAMHKWIPERRSADNSFHNTSNYTVELMVPTDNPAVGMTLEEAGLYNVPGGRLIEVVRFDKEVITPVQSDEFVLGGDRLVYAGEVEEILSLKKSHSLVNATHHVFSVSEVDPNRKLRTATVKYGSTLVGHKVSETDFEKNNNMVLVAVSREGEMIRQSPREITLHPGDALLLECPPKSTNPEAYTKDISFFESMTTVQADKKTAICASVIALMLILVATRVLTLLQGTLAAAMVLLLCKCVTTKQARKGISWELLMIIACSIAFGKAIQNNGISDMIAMTVQKLSGGSPLLSLFIVSLTAMIVTTFFSNTVSAAIFFPISYQCAIVAGCSPLPFAIATMLSINASYATPFSSPVNTAVYGPGGYKFTDYVKIGVPLGLVQLASIMIIVPLLFPLDAA